MSLAWLETLAMSLRDEFRAWLIKEERYEEHQLKELLDEPWDTSDPFEWADDINGEIESFMWYMAEFAAVKVYKEDPSPIYIRTMTYADIEDHSKVLLWNVDTSMVLAYLDFGHYCGASPESIESDLKDLVAQLEKSKREEAYRSFNFR